MKTERSINRIRVPKPRKPRRKRILRADAPARILELGKLIQSTKALPVSIDMEPRELAQRQQKIEFWTNELDTLDTAINSVGRSKYIYLTGGAK